MGSPFNTGKGTETDPYILPTVTVRAKVPVNRYQEFANGLSYVQPGSYGPYYFPAGFYLDPRNGGGGSSGGGNSGGGGNSSGESAPPPLPNKLPNATLPVDPKDGQKFTYLDSQGNQVTLVYNKVLNTWVLPEVSVKAARPTQR